MVFASTICKASKQTIWKQWLSLSSLSERERKEDPPLSRSLPLYTFNSQHYLISNAVGGNWKYVFLFTKGKHHNTWLTNEIIWINNIINNYTPFCCHLLCTPIHFQCPQVLQVNVYFSKYCVSTYKHTLAKTKQKNSFYIPKLGSEYLKQQYILPVRLEHSLCWWI